jgi:hypothetical protein
MTSVAALQMSAFGGKAEMTNRKYPLVRSLLGVKRTSLAAPHMSAFDPKRTFGCRTCLDPHKDTGAAPDGGPAVKSCSVRYAALADPSFSEANRVPSTRALIF